MADIFSQTMNNEQRDENMEKVEEIAPDNQQKSSRLSLWYFLLDLLGMKDSDHLVQWTDKVKLEFRFVHPQEVAFLWGRLNGKDNMTYAKFSRAIRYYYGKQVLEKVPNKRFHYRFIKSAKTKFAMEKNLPSVDKCAQEVEIKTEDVEITENVLDQVDTRKNLQVKVIERKQEKQEKQQHKQQKQPQQHKVEPINETAMQWFPNPEPTTVKLEELNLPEPINTIGNKRKSNPFYGDLFESESSNRKRQYFQHVNSNIPRVGVKQEEGSIVDQIVPDVDMSDNIDVFKDIPGLTERVSIQDLSNIQNLVGLPTYSSPIFENAQQQQQQQQQQQRVSPNHDSSYMSNIQQHPQFSGPSLFPEEFTRNSPVSTQQTNILQNTQTSDLVFDLSCDVSLDDIGAIMNNEMDNAMDFLRANNPTLSCWR